MSSLTQNWFSNFAAVFSAFWSLSVVVEYIYGKFATATGSGFWWLLVLITTIWGLVVLFTRWYTAWEMREQIARLEGELLEARNRVQR